MKKILRLGLAAMAVFLLFPAPLVRATTAEGSSEAAEVPVGTKRRIVWAMANSALQNIREANQTEAQRHFDNADSFVTGPAAGRQYQVPGAWASVAAANYKSYALFEQHITTSQIDSRVRWVKYNPEKWDLTPPEEQRDPYTFMRKFCSLAHENGYACMLAPSRDLLLVNGSVCPKRQGENLNQGYIRCRVAEHAASHADQLSIQAQVNQRDSALYRDFVLQAAQQAKAANPKVVVLSNLTTVLHGEVQTACTLFSAHAAVQDIVSGHWLNVTGDTGPIAVEFLRGIQAGHCPAA